LTPAVSTRCKAPSDAAVAPRLESCGRRPAAGASARRRRRGAAVPIWPMNG